MRMTSTLKQASLLLLLLLAAAAGMPRWPAQAKTADNEAQANGRYFLQPQAPAASGLDDLAELGGSLAMEGDTLVVGASGARINGKANQGAVYVFVRIGDNWVELQSLTASDGQSGDRLGASVAISGSTILAGAPFDDAGGMTDRGSVYVFTLQSVDWDQAGKLEPSTGADAGAFGSAVDLLGETAVIGAPGEPAGAGAGAVYLFSESISGWQEQDRVSPTGGARFGASLKLDGERFIAGAPETEVNGETKRGAAYVYARDGQSWSLEQELTAAEGKPYDLFGHSVALDGVTAAAGAPGDLSTTVGSAYLFRRSGSTWSQEQRLENLGAGAQSKFGSSLALNADMLAVGARTADVGDIAFAGAAFVYALEGSQWQLQQQVAAPDGQGFDQFGTALVADGEWLAVGATGADQPGVNGGGQVYVAGRGQQPWPRTGGHAANNSRTGFSIFSVAISGDTALIGVPGATVDFAPYRGLVYVYERSGGGWQFLQELTAADGRENDGFGATVAVEGDTAFIAAPAADKDGEGFASDGVVYVYERSGGGWSFVRRLVAGDDTGTSGAFGRAIDLDGDRALIGAWGAAYTFTHGATGWEPEQRLNASVTDTVDRFGTAVALDGGTALVGAIYAGDGDEGRAYLFTREGGSWQVGPALAAENGQENDRFGLSVGLDGNTAVAGADWAAVGENSRQGAAYVFQNLGGGWTQTQRLVAPDGGEDNYFGAALALDQGSLLLGAPYAPLGPLEHQGAVYAFARQGSDWVWEQKLAPYGAGEQLGVKLALDGQTAAAGTYDSEGGPPAENGPDHVVFFERLAAPAGAAPVVYLPLISGQ